MTLKKSAWGEIKKQKEKILCYNRVIKQGGAAGENSSGAVKSRLKISRILV